MTVFMYGVTETYDNMADVLSTSFYWKTTEEGYDYWRNVCTNLRTIKQTSGEYGLVGGGKLIDAFEWCDTKQGCTYWKKVYDKLNAIKQEYIASKEHKEENKTPMIDAINYWIDDANNFLTVDSSRGTVSELKEENPLTPKQELDNLLQTIKL